MACSSKVASSNFVVTVNEMACHDVFVRVKSSWVTHTALSVETSCSRTAPLSWDTVARTEALTV